MRSEAGSVFVGTEARDLPPIAAYAVRTGPVDVALLPVNAVRFLHARLVMSGPEAVKAACVLCAQSLFVIHDAHAGFPLIAPVGSSGAETEAAAQGTDLMVVRLDPGQPWAFARKNK